MSKPFLGGEPTTFTELYPSVKSLILTGIEHGDYTESSIIPYNQRGRIHYTASTLPRVIPCSNPKCKQGGYDLQWIIDSIVSLGEPSYINVFSCNGHEGTSKERKIGSVVV